MWTVWLSATRLERVGPPGSRAVRYAPRSLPPTLGQGDAMREVGQREMVYGIWLVRPGRERALAADLGGGVGWVYLGCDLGLLSHLSSGRGQRGQRGQRGSGAAGQRQL